MDMDKTLRYGLIGCGSMGREHIENLQAMGGVAVTAQHADEARTLLAFMAAPASAPAKQRQGMEPA